MLDQGLCTLGIEQTEPRSVRMLWFAPGSDSGFELTDGRPESASPGFGVAVQTAHGEPRAVLYAALDGPSDTLDRRTWLELAEALKRTTRSSPGDVKKLAEFLALHDGPFTADVGALWPTEALGAPWPGDVWDLQQGGRSGGHEIGGTPSTDVPELDKVDSLTLDTVLPYNLHMQLWPSAAESMELLTRVVREHHIPITTLEIEDGYVRVQADTSLRDSLRLEQDWARSLDLAFESERLARYFTHNDFDAIEERLRELFDAWGQEDEGGFCPDLGDVGASRILETHAVDRGLYGQGLHPRAEYLGYSSSFWRALLRQVLDGAGEDGALSTVRYAYGSCPDGGSEAAFGIAEAAGWVASSGAEGSAATPAGRMLAGAHSQRYRRSTALKRLQGLARRVEAVNKDPDRLYRIPFVMVFGSLLRDTDRVGDVDVVVAVRNRDLPDWGDRKSARRDELLAERSSSLSIIEYASLPLTALMQELKGRSPILQLHNGTQSFRDGVLDDAVFAYGNGSDLETTLLKGDVDEIDRALQAAPSRSHLYDELDAAIDAQDRDRVRELAGRLPSLDDAA